MKKLMMTAAAVALAGVATAGNVFDYKASVKYVDFKQVSYSGTKVWVKTVKSTTLKGYLVTPIGCACDKDAQSQRDPGFLVLTSSLAKKYDKDYQVKLMPANLLADMWTQKSIAGNAKSATLDAQGYLFAGIGKSAYPGVAAASPAYGFGDINVTQATRYLFGQANIEDDPDYEAGSGDEIFIEPFLDAAGFGKAAWSSTAAPICGKGSEGYCLKSLSGSVIGGCWSCLANAFVESYLCQGWNDEGDYDGYGYKYNVISGTWSIKENTNKELNAPTTVEGLVTVCGQKLQSSFSLVTFDYDGILPGKFVEKWMAQ